MSVITRLAPVRHGFDPKTLPAFCACSLCRDFAYETTGGRRRGPGRTIPEERAAVRTRPAPRHRAA